MKKAIMNSHFAFFGPLCGTKARTALLILGIFGFAMFSLASTGSRPIFAQNGQDERAGVLEAAAQTDSNENARNATQAQESGQEETRGFGDVLVTPKLVIEGPEFQSYYAFIRYFDQGELSKSLQSRLTVGDSTAELELEFGHEGLKVILVSPTTSPSEVRLVDGDQTIATKLVGKLGDTVEITHGETAEEDLPMLPRVMPNEADRAFIEKVLSAIERQDTRSLVSSSPQVNVQWQTLDAFATSLTTELGKRLSASPQLDGWLSWKGNLGSRVLSGPITFERGVCHLTFVEIDGLLVDVQARSRELSEDWFQGPASEEAFVSAARQVAQLIFAEQDTTADLQQLFARKLHETITRERLREFRQQMQAEYGDSIHGIELLDTRVEPLTDQQQTRDYEVFLRLHMRDGEDCICNTRFEFNSGFPADSEDAGSLSDSFVRIGIGQLVGVNIRPSWPSAAPSQAKAALQLLQQLGNGELDPALWHPLATSTLDMEQMQAALKTIRARFGELSGTQLETWAGEESAALGWAQGNVGSDRGPVQLKIDFIEDKILGFGLASPNSNFESYAHVRDAQKLGYQGNNFWTRLLKGDLPDAHRVLSEDFRAQLPLSRFEKLVESSGLAAGRKLKQVVWDVTRVADRLDRKLPLIVSTYHWAEFQNGDVQALRCEFRRGEEAWEMIDFTSDFAKVFPSESNHPAFVSLAQSIATQNAKQIIEQLSPVHAEFAKAPILRAFLHAVHDELASVALPDEAYVRQIVRYDRGMRQVTCTALLQTGKESRRLMGTFVNNHLTSFAIDLEQPVRFVDRVEEPHWYADFAQMILKDWMLNESRMISMHQTESLRANDLMNRLQALKSTWRLTFGEFETVVQSKERLRPSRNEVDCELNLKFEAGEVRLLITFEVDAFTARIAEFRVLESPLQ